MDLVYPQPSHWRSVVISTLCLLGMGTALYLLHQDLESAAPEQGAAPLAIYEQGSDNVRRKPSSSYLWRSIQAGSALYRKDSLKVGPGGSATVLLNNGTRLELGENSLVIIDDLKQLLLQFVHGSFIVRDAIGDREVIARDGRTTTRALAVRLINPLPNATLSARSETLSAVSFQWELTRPAQSATGVDLHIATEKSFSPRTSRVYRVSLTDKRRLVELPAGRYYWRLAENKTPLSEARSFAIAPLHPLVPLSPPDRSTVVRWSSETGLLFRWGGSKVALPQTEHFLELSQRPSFDVALIQERISPYAASHLQSGLEEGTYFWRLRSQRGSLIVTSPVQAFTLIAGKPVPIQLTFPAENATLEFRPQLPFRWETDLLNEAEFRWELALPDGTVHKVFRTPLRLLEWATPPPGQYRWRVLAMKGKDKVGESTWRKLEITPPVPLVTEAPENGQAFFFWDEAPQVEFSWRAEENFTDLSYRYEIEVATTPDFSSDVLRKKTHSLKISSRELDLKAGEYYWRVRLLDAAGRAIKSSVPKKFSLGLPSPLTEVTLQGPANGETIHALEDGDPVLSWKALESAQAYLVRVYQSDQMVLEKKTKTLSLTLPGLKPGRYTWSVTAIDPANRPGRPSETREMNVEHGARLKAPESTDWELE